MRKIYIAKIPPVYAPVTYECYCRKVDEERLAKVRHIRPDQSRMGCLLAGCLLQWAVKEWLADQEGFADESAQPDKDIPIDQEVFNEKEMPTNQEGSLILAPFWIKSVEIEEMVSPPLPLNYGYGGGVSPT
ncbi:MAG: hypothetical protein LBV33_02855 [Lachnospiraceae bacterium]|jgi:hypothetical protein|nr:hypothetical protein [Lachnospiraceae bacterium]